jgi:hypothetical protein
MNMKTRSDIAVTLARPLTLLVATLTGTAQRGTPHNVPPARPQGSCDIYTAAGDSCVAAYSTTRALYASYKGPLYEVLRQSDGKTLNIGVVEPVAAPSPDSPATSPRLVRPTIMTVYLRRTVSDSSASLRAQPSSFHLGWYA